ncbi:hypothetical protein EES41_40340 (plasmid) [Streptomyces sp. ADI95-16]|nr:hypothetical protein EES41_40340 [Streptomyces sp. ADI95-16]
MLHEQGTDAFGLDLSPGMVDHARRAHPELRFQEARMDSLPIKDGALGGILAHYSMRVPVLLGRPLRAWRSGVVSGLCQGVRRG